MGLWINKNACRLPNHYCHSRQSSSFAAWQQIFSQRRPDEHTHALSITSRSHPPVEFYNRLITYYSNSGKLSVAQKLFDTMPYRSSVSYNSMISAFARNGNVQESFIVISHMLGKEGIKPSEFTFGSVLASPVIELDQGMSLHCFMLKAGMIFNYGQFSATTLLGFYGRHRRLDDVMSLFEEMPERGVVAWNTVIIVSAKELFLEDCLLLFREFWRNNGSFVASDGTFVGILVAIKLSPEYPVYVEVIHGLVLRLGMDAWINVANALLDVYFVCYGPQIATERLFTYMINRDVVSWNTMITVFSKSEMPGKALELFFGMVLDQDGLSRTETTYTSAISACASSDAFGVYGEILHAKVVKNSFVMREFASNALMDFYVKHKRLDDSRCLFDEIPVKTIVSWNTLLAGHMKNKIVSNDGCDYDDYRACVTLLREMLRLEGLIRPNEFTFSATIRSLPVLELQQLHSLIIKMAYDSNEYILSAAIASYSLHGYLSEALGLVATLDTPVLTTVPANTTAGAYNRCGQYREAQSIVSHLQNPDTISWNVLITSYSRTGDYDEAFSMLKKMLKAKASPDKYTAVSLFSICKNLNRLDLGSSLHGLLIKLSFKSSSFDVFSQNVLLDMYAKCGNLESSLRVFEGMDERNLISWTVLITALGLHGHGKLALEKFRQMEAGGLKPDRVVFVAILSACRHAGLVEEGMKLFQSMERSYGIEPDMDHFVCVIDLLCRNGYLEEAEGVITRMPFQPNAVIWRIFLNSCKKIREGCIDQECDNHHKECYYQTVADDMKIKKDCNIFAR